MYVRRVCVYVRVCVSQQSNKYKHDNYWVLRVYIFLLPFVLLTHHSTWAVWGSITIATSSCLYTCPSSQQRKAKQILVCPTGSESLSLLAVSMGLGYGYITVCLILFANAIAVGNWPLPLPLLDIWLQRRRLGWRQDHLWHQVKADLTMDFLLKDRGRVLRPIGRILQDRLCRQFQVS